MKHNQKGFGPLEIIIIIVILGLIGFGGWYVWKKQKDTDKKSTTTTQQQDASTNPEPAPPAPDPTADWVAYTNAPGKFSFKHPKAWVFAERPELCSEGLVLFASDIAAVGRCASESAGQMMALGTVGDERDNYKLGQGYLTDYADVQETNVTVDSAAGIKQTAVAMGQEGPGSLPDGTKLTQYLFYANGNTYMARYTQQAGYPDALADFDTLVTRTLRFSSP